jgi:hypothetical protein
VVSSACTRPFGQIDLAITLTVMLKPNSSFVLNIRGHSAVEPVRS